MSLQLIVVGGPDVGRVFTMQPGPELMLGRSQSCLYRLNDPRVSRAHCQLILDGDKAIVADNGGSGGTKVNGNPITRHTLKLGDVIQIGDTQLRVHMGDFPLDVALAAVAGIPTPAQPPSPAGALSILEGQKLSHFQIGSILGVGRSGVVFHATDVNDSKPVAIKVLAPEMSKDDEAVQRFVRAMKTILPLQHPNLIRLCGAGKTKGYCWIAMEFVDGENLTGVIKRIGVAGMLDWRHAFRAAVHIGRALVYAHDKNVIHRNVTPTNIVRQESDSVYKLGDLMLAKAIEGSLAEQITRPGELVGDVEYMSPERTRGTEDVDERSDLYGLGATVYAMLTGKPPCAGKTLVEKITRIRQVVPEKPTKVQMSIPSMFEGVVMKLLAKEPDKRYQSAGGVVKELERIAKFNGVVT